MKTSEIRKAVEARILQGKPLNKSFVTSLSKAFVHWCEAHADIYRCPGHYRHSPWVVAAYAKLFGGNLCSICGGQKLFRDIKRGFAAYCSSRCAGADTAVQAKREATNLKRYGVNHVQSVPEVRQKFRRSMKLAYGVSYSGQSSVLTRKARTTNMKRTGYATTFANPAVQASSKATMLERYGVEHCLQIRAVHEAQQKAGFKTRTLKLADGQVFTNLRGYEPEALAWLSTQGKKFATTSASGVPSIKWRDKQGVDHYYHPDAFIQRTRTVVEVKSTYTLGLGNCESLFYATRRKLQACIDQGFRVMLLLVDKGRVVHVKDWSDKRSVVTSQCLAALAEAIPLQQSRRHGYKIVA